MGGRDRLIRALGWPLLLGFLIACGPAATGAPLATADPAPRATATLAATPPAAIPAPSTAGAARAAASASPIAAIAPQSSATAPLPPFTLSPTQPTSCFAAGFAEPDPATYVALIAPVREYLYYRKRAFISGDTSEFLARYPALGQGNDPAASVNDEARLIAIYKRTFTLIDGDIDPEHYGRMTVRRDGASADVIIRMLEVYIQRDFSITGGQTHLKLSLQQIGDTWTVVRTDALNEGESARERQCR